MLRRQLFVYTFMFSIGIVCGYTILDRQIIIRGMIVIATTLFVLYKIDLECEDPSGEKKKLLVMMLAGFVIFTFSYIDSNNSLIDSDGNPIDAESVNEIIGCITDIEEKNDYYQIDLKCKDPLDGEKVRVSFYGDSQELCGEAAGIEALYGRYVRLKGKIKVPSSRTNPECFDYRLYLRSLGIYYSFTAKSVESIEYEEGRIESIFHAYKRYLMKKRAIFEEAFKDEGESAAVLKGVIWGDKSAISEDIRDTFNENGTGHVLAVSGLHIGFIFALLKAMSKKRKTLFISILMALIVVFYGEMTCWSPSTIRAVLVLSVNIFAMHVRRPFDLLSSISFVALVLLTFNPYQLFNTGFQMTFLAMLGIAFFGKTLEFFVGSYWAIMLAVMLAIAPFSAFVFNRFNPLTILVNIPIVFLVSILVPCCFIGIGFSSLIGVIPKLLAQVICGLCQMLIDLNDWLNFGGVFSEVSLGYNLGVLVLIYAILLILSSEWARIKLIRREYAEIKTVCVFAMALAISIGVAYNNSFRNDEIVFVDVGQGDCTHVRAGSIDVLIDGGGNTRTNVGEKILLPYLVKNGISDIDVAIATHLHTDHFKGLQELDEIYTIRSIAVPIPTEVKPLESEEDSSVKRKGQSDKSGMNITESNKRFNLRKNSFIEPIWPIDIEMFKMQTSSDENENNMAYMVHYDGVKALITGDMTGEDEIAMSAYYRGRDTLDCDILKVSHHGSKSSTTKELLEATSPQIAIISVGSNFYGHPSEDVIKRLEAFGIKVYRTDLDGAVGIDLKNGKIRQIDTMK